MTLYVSRLYFQSRECPQHDEYLNENFVRYRVTAFSNFFATCYALETTQQRSWKRIHGLSETRSRLISSFERFAKQST